MLSFFRQHHYQSEIIDVMSITHDSRMVSTTPASAIPFNIQIDSSTTSSILLSWGASNNFIHSTILAYQVHYQKEASKYVQYGPRLPSTSSEFNIQNLVADTFYKICLVIYQNNTVTPDRECVDASTSNWRIPVSISVGSSIGAVLALFLIMLIVVAVARCPSTIRWPHKQKMTCKKYDSISSHFHYDFSDTVTHEREDDITSDHSETELHREGCNASPHHHHSEHRTAAAHLCNGHHHNHHQVTFSDPPTRCTGARPKVQIPKHCQHSTCLGKKQLMSHSSTDSETDHVTLVQQMKCPEKWCENAQICFSDDIYNIQVLNRPDGDFNHSPVCCSKHQSNDFLFGPGSLEYKAGSSVLVHKAPSPSQMEVSSSDSGYKETLHKAQSESFEDENAFFSATDNFASDLETNEGKYKNEISDEYEMTDLTDKLRSVHVSPSPGIDQSV